MRPVEVSIIIATRNREAILRETLAKACACISGRDTEIIVINDGDFSVEILPSDINQITYFDNPRKGVSSARNLGALKAKGEFLFFVDDDMWINQEILDWIHGELIQKKRAEAIYNINWEYPPALKRDLKNSKIGRYILASRYHTMWGRMKAPGQQPESGLYPFNAVASCSMLLSKRLFNKIGGYNEGIAFQGEDKDLADRINQMGIPIFCVFDTTLYHNHTDRLKLKDFLERIGTGYHSEFLAEKRGLIPGSLHPYRGWNAYLFKTALCTERFWLGLHRFIPKIKIFDPLTNRLTGLLSGLEKFRQWKKVFIQSNT